MVGARGVNHTHWECFMGVARTTRHMGNTPTCTTELTVVTQVQEEGARDLCFCQQRLLRHVLLLFTITLVRLVQTDYIVYYHVF